MPWRKPSPRSLTDAEIIERSRIDPLADFNKTPRLLYWGGWRQPRLFARNHVPAADRAAVIDALVSGQPLVAWMGVARCRICHGFLGSWDMLTHGMIYPQKAEHYLLEHRVWTPECDELLRRLRARSAR